MIIYAIENALKRAKKQGWEKTYWVFDLHDTIIKSDYGRDGIIEFFPYALAVLKILRKDPSIVLILWTSSYYKNLTLFFSNLERQGIIFDYFNENPEAKNTTYGNFQDKFYFNVLFDDKAGFNPETDWKIVLDYLQKRYKSTAK